jgi:hypothetical protein
VAPESGADSPEIREARRRLAEARKAMLAEKSAEETDRYDRATGRLSKEEARELFEMGPSARSELKSRVTRTPDGQLRLDEASAAAYVAKLDELAPRIDRMMDLSQPWRLYGSLARNLPQEYFPPDPKYLALQRAQAALWLLEARAGIEPTGLRKAMEVPSLPGAPTAPSDPVARVEVVEATGPSRALTRTPTPPIQGEPPIPVRDPVPAQDPRTNPAAARLRQSTLEALDQMRVSVSLEYGTVEQFLDQVRAAQPGLPIRFFDAGAGGAVWDEGLLSRRTRRMQLVIHEAESPLRIALRHGLGRAGLGYFVSDDGIIVIGDLDSKAYEAEAQRVKAVPGYGVGPAVPAASDPPPGPGAIRETP